MTENSRPVYKSRGMQEVEHRQGEPIDAILRRLYLTERKTQPEIARALGVDQGTVSRWLRAFDIEVPPVTGPRRKRAVA